MLSQSAVVRALPAAVMSPSTFDWGDFNPVSRLLMYKIDKIGPNTDPRSTPPVT